MIIELKTTTFLVFDLDDTLYKEFDYLQSAYRFIGTRLQPYLKDDITHGMLEQYYAGNNVFEWIVNQYRSCVPDLSVAKLLKMYRKHEPDIELSPGVKEFLEALDARKIKKGLITDGRSITQRNKLKALGLTKYFNDVIISEEFGSEKPDSRNFEYFIRKYPDASFYFIGDNTQKDFDAPEKLGWVTICIRDFGTNIHKQDFNRSIKPQHIISSFAEIQLE